MPCFWDYVQVVIRQLGRHVARSSGKHDVVGRTLPDAHMGLDIVQPEPPVAQLQSKTLDRAVYPPASTFDQRLLKVAPGTVVVEEMKIRGWRAFHQQLHCLARI